MDLDLFKSTRQYILLGRRGEQVALWGIRQIPQSYTNAVEGLNGKGGGHDRYPRER
jgi:hypothetical protein